MALPSRFLSHLLRTRLFQQTDSLRYFHPRAALSLTVPSLASHSLPSAVVNSSDQELGPRAFRIEPWNQSAVSDKGPPQDPKTLPPVEADLSKTSVKGRAPEQEPKTIPPVAEAKIHRASGSVKQDAALGVAEAKKMIHEESEKAHARSDREEILEAAMTHVVTLGWSEAALAAGARDLGLSPAAAGVFTRGGWDLLEHFVDQCNNKLAKEVEEEGAAFSKLSTKDKLIQAIKLRLEMQAAYITTWPQALALQARPQNMATALKQRARLVDVLWEVTGDTSVDASWYAKRGLVAAVYGSTEVYMLQDFSPGFADTWRFLNRRIEEAVELKKSADEFKHLAEAVGAGLGNTLGSTFGRLMGSGSSRNRKR